MLQDTRIVLFLLAEWLLLCKLTTLTAQAIAVWGGVRSMGESCRRVADRVVQQTE